MGMFNRRKFIHTSALASATASSFPHSSLARPGQAKPNILYLCSDQQHWEAMGIKDRFFDTPHSDALARESVVFDNAICTTPQCSPSRSSMLTGFYPHQTGMMNNSGASGGTNLDLETIGPKLQRGGYRTGFYGKWHLGGKPQGNAGWHEEEKKGPDSKTTARGIDFIKRHANDEEPFALFLMYLDPHDIYHFKPGAKDISQLNVSLSPSWHGERFQNKPPIQKQFMTDNQGTIIWDQPQGVWEAYRDLYREKVRLYDNHVGAVIKALKEQGLWENTIIVNTSDHGDMDTQHKLIFKGPFMYEHMVRIPLTVRVPEAFGGRTSRHVTDYDWVNVDTVPTLLDLAGLPLPECHGQSAKAVITGQGNAKSRDYTISQYYGKQTWVNPIRMIRTHDLKYNLHIEHGEELYDLKNDPHELVNRARDKKFDKQKTELRAELEGWIKQHQDPFHSFKTTALKKSEWKNIQKGRGGKKRRNKKQAQ
jgi:arylsulfatase